MLVAWLLVLVAAIAVGTTTRDHIREPSLAIPGSESDRADKLTRKEFGGTVSMAVLLKGPPKVVEQRGPRVVRELQKVEDVQVLSPWAIGGSRVLKEPAGEAMLALQVRKPFEEISEETVPAVERVLDREETERLEAELTGLAPLVRALNEASLDSLHRGELIALPVLFLMLLLDLPQPGRRARAGARRAARDQARDSADGADRQRRRDRRAGAEPRDDGRPRARRRLRAARRLAIPRGA